MQDACNSWKQRHEPAAAEAGPQGHSPAPAHTLQHNQDQGDSSRGQQSTWTAESALVGLQPCIIVLLRPQQTRSCQDKQ